MQPESTAETNPGVFSRLGRHLLVLGFSAVGTLVGMALVNRGVPGSIASTFVGAEPAAYWNFSRATAFGGYILLWLSMVLGISITKKIGRVWPGGPALTDLHEYASLLGLGLTFLHIVSLAGDRFIGFTWQQLFVPFASTYEPFWVGLGQAGFYLLAAVTFSFYVRRQIGYRAWRALHFASFLVFLLALLHGIFSGSDTGTPWASLLYSFSGASVLLLTAYRVFHARVAAGLRAQPAA